MKPVFNEKKTMKMIQKIILTFPSEVSGDPIIYELIRRYDIKVNILKAEIQPGQIGTLLVELDADADRLEQAKEFFTSRGISINPVAGRISYDESRCIQCGNCALACFAGALRIAAPEWRLHFDPEKCIVCKLCLKSCPLHLFRIEFSPSIEI